MSTKRCMNGGCGAAAGGGVWRKGWMLRSGGFATLCDKCGLTYEKLIFCESFHQKESGWRECAFCGKRLHCGCIASKSMLDLLDGGGVQCLTCLKNYGNASIPGESVQGLLPQSSQRVLTLSAWRSTDEKMNDFDVSSPVNGSSELQITSSDRIITDDVPTKCNLMQMGRSVDVNGYSTILLAQRENKNGSFSHVKQEQVALYRGDLGRSGCSGKGQSLLGFSHAPPHENDSKDALKDYLSNPLADSCLSMSLGGMNAGNSLETCSNAGTRHIAVSHHGIIDDGRDQSKVLTSFQNVHRARHVLPKLPKASHDVSKELVPQMRVARPPAEGRGRNQLLPRYWPRITDQELQQISGDSNSTIVPLFEKVLSASDAGRIGRLVLPKACAEAYFPPISQPEGIPLKIQDAKGKEWHFQFRYWPNNNSRMYVLEGVTPCIQSLQLQAGDTVTFSRIDPEGKLVMGFRKATNTAPLQESQISALTSGVLSSETFYSGGNVNLLVSGCSGLLQSLKGTRDPPLSHISENLIYAEGDVCCVKTDKHGSWANEALAQPLLTPDKRRSRNIGSKSKRLIMDDDDAMELKLSWEEAQDLLRPPPTVQPSIVIIEDQEFEEYEEPPVLGKITFFTARASGGQDQWIQCDDCFKWRRIPVDFLPPSKWTCAENTLYSKRSSCAVPEELSSREVQHLLRQHSELKRQRISSSKQSPSEAESTGLDALATAMVLGEAGNQASPSAATTTRHPRHRPGCSCIVCIQPPSGKGPKHSPTCTCNVCLTVKRRFKTLMMRKKKRQSEREEAEASKKLSWGSREELEGTSGSMNVREGDLMEALEISKGHIDLNSQPQRDAEQRASSSPQMSMMNLLQVASLPLENYMKQNRLASLAASEQQVSSSSATIPQAPVESESGGDDDLGGSDKVRSDAAI